MIENMMKKGSIFISVLLVSIIFASSISAAPINDEVMVESQSIASHDHDDHDHSVNAETIVSDEFKQGIDEEEADVEYCNCGGKMYASNQVLKQEVSSSPVGCTYRLCPTGGWSCLAFKIKNNLYNSWICYSCNAALRRELIGTETIYKCTSADEYYY